MLVVVGYYFIYTFKDANSILHSFGDDISFPSLKIDSIFFLAFILSLINFVFSPSIRSVVSFICIHLTLWYFISFSLMEWGQSSRVFFFFCSSNFLLSHLFFCFFNVFSLYHSRPFLSLLVEPVIFIFFGRTLLDEERNVKLNQKKFFFCININFHFFASYLIFSVLTVQNNWKMQIFFVRSVFSVEKLIRTKKCEFFSHFFDERIFDWF